MRNGIGGFRAFLLLNQMAWEGLTKQMTTEQRQEGGEGVSHVDARKKSILGSGNSLCKGPGVAHLVCPSSVRSPVLRKLSEEGKEVRGELRQVVWACRLWLGLWLSFSAHREPACSN